MNKTIRKERVHNIKVRIGETKNGWTELLFAKPFEMKAGRTYELKSMGRVDSFMLPTNSSLSRIYSYNG